MALSKRQIAIILAEKKKAGGGMNAPQVSQIVKPPAIGNMEQVKPLSAKDIGVPTAPKPMKFPSLNKLIKIKTPKF